MKIVHCMAALLLTGVLAGACADAPTAPDVRSEVDIVPSRDVLLDPVIVIGQPKDSCDPYLSLDWCDDGGGQCMMSNTEPTGPEATTMLSCPGEGSGGAGGDGPIGGEGSTGDGSGSTSVTGTGPFAEGPLLWAACVVAVIGGTFSVDVVADKFVAWYDAHKALIRARNALNLALDYQRRGYYVEPASLELTYYRLDVATEARDAAVGAVEEATGVSILTLIGAGFACGAAVAAPTA
jgi:hypothetical protein